LIANAPDKISKTKKERIKPELSLLLELSGENPFQCPQESYCSFHPILIKTQGRCPFASHPTNQQREKKEMIIIRYYSILTCKGCEKMITHLIHKLERKQEKDVKKDLPDSDLLVLYYWLLQVLSLCLTTCLECQKVLQLQKHR